jgi:hypothetical protein
MQLSRRFQAMAARSASTANAVRVLIISSATLALTACANLQGYPQNPDSRETLSGLQARYFGPNADAAYEAVSPADPSYAQKRQSIRDDIVYGRMRAYDIEFSLFQRALNSNGNGINVGGDLTALVLNGLGATTGNAGTKSALAAASAGVIGAEGAVNKDLFYQQTVPAIIAQMEANRTVVKLAIFRGLARSDADYSLPRAESDLLDLNDAGSLPNAINNITQKSTDQKNAAATLIQSIHSTTFAVTDSATKIRAWLRPGGVVDASHVAALQAWLNQQPEAFVHGDVMPIATFASSDTAASDLEPIRARALTDPTLNIPH